MPHLDRVIDSYAQERNTPDTAWAAFAGTGVTGGMAAGAEAGGGGGGGGGAAAAAAGASAAGEGAALAATA